MKKHTASPDDLDLFQLAEAGQKLEQRNRELEDHRRKVELERIERETTLPPSDLVDEIQKRKRHEGLASLNEVRKVRRERGRALLLLALLTAMTATLIWWGLKLMHGA